MATPQALERLSSVMWELPSSSKDGMGVPARIIGTEKLIQQMDEAVCGQIAHVTCSRDWSITRIPRSCFSCLQGLEIREKQKDRGYLLEASARGEKIDPPRHRLRVDVKAMILYQFHRERTESGWSAHVILDIWPDLRSRNLALRQDGL